MPSPRDRTKKSDIDPRNGVMTQLLNYSRGYPGQGSKQPSEQSPKSKSRATKEADEKRDQLINKRRIQKRGVSKNCLLDKVIRQEAHEQGTQQTIENSYSTRDVRDGKITSPVTA